MAITLVGTLQVGNATNGGNVTLTFDGTRQAGDVVVVFGGHPHRAATPLGPSTAGYIEIAKHDAAAPNFGAWYKVLGPSGDATVVCQGTANGDDATAYCSYVLRGVDPAIFDQTTVTTGPTTSTNPDCAAIVTQTAAAWVLALAGSQVNDASVTVPTGYTNLATINGNDVNDITVAGARIEKATPGSENPPAFTTWSSGAWYGITIALKVDLNAAVQSGITQFPDDDELYEHLPLEQTETQTPNIVEEVLPAPEQSQPEFPTVLEEYDIEAVSELDQYTQLQSPLVEDNDTLEGIASYEAPVVTEDYDEEIVSEHDNYTQLQSPLVDDNDPIGLGSTELSSEVTVEEEDEAQSELQAPLADTVEDPGLSSVELSSEVTVEEQEEDQTETQQPLSENVEEPGLSVVELSSDSLVEDNPEETQTEILSPLADDFVEQQPGITAIPEEDPIDGEDEAQSELLSPQPDEVHDVQQTNFELSAEVTVEEQEESQEWTQSPLADSVEEVAPGIQEQAEGVIEPEEEELTAHSVPLAEDNDPLPALPELSLDDILAGDQEEIDPQEVQGVPQEIEENIKLPILMDGAEFFELSPWMEASYGWTDYQQPDSVEDGLNHYETVQDWFYVEETLPEDWQSGPLSEETAEDFQPQPEIPTDDWWYEHPHDEQLYLSDTQGQQGFCLSGATATLAVEESPTGVAAEQDDPTASLSIDESPTGRLDEEICP